MTDLTPNDALCPQGEHAPGPEPLSPAAQAILAAMEEINLDFTGENNLVAAAALRALADAVVPEEPGPTGMRKSVEQFTYQEYRRAMRQETRASILALATELENIND